MRYLVLVVVLFWLPITAAADELSDYGEYLAGECTSCHRIDGTDKGIPSIVGWDTGPFVIVMNSYKNKERMNEAMISVATSLNDRQILALATYFGSLEAKDK